MEMQNGYEDNYDKSALRHVLDVLTFSPADRTPPPSRLRKLSYSKIRGWRCSRNDPSRIREEPSGTSRCRTGPGKYTKQRQ